MPRDIKAINAQVENGEDDVAEKSGALTEQ